MTDPRSGGGNEVVLQRMESALRDLLATTWDFLEDCATREQLSEAAIRARRRVEALGKGK